VKPRRGTTSKPDTLARRVYAVQNQSKRCKRPTDASRAPCQLHAVPETSGVRRRTRRESPNRWRTRIAAFLLAGFSLLTALAFHDNFANQPQAIEFLKDVSIAGVLLVLFVNGAGPLGIDHRRSR
jgi:hypothetical protein